MYTPKNILVATALDDLGRIALDTALGLASALHSKVHVLHVVALPGGEDSMHSLHELQLAERHADSKLQSLADAIRPTGRLGEVAARVGIVPTTILEHAKHLGADLIVVGTHARHGLSRVVMGSVAEEVLRRAECPVLCTKHFRREHTSDEHDQSGDVHPVP